MAFVFPTRPATCVSGMPSRASSRCSSRASGARSNNELAFFRTSRWAEAHEEEVEVDEEDNVWRPRSQKGRLAPKLTKGQQRVLNAKKDAQKREQREMRRMAKSMADLYNREMRSGTVMHVPLERPLHYNKGQDTQQQYFAPPSLATFGFRDLHPIRFQGDFVHKPKYQNDWGDIYSEETMDKAKKSNPMAVYRPAQKWDDVDHTDYSKNVKKQHAKTNSLPPSSMGAYGWEVSQMKRGAFAPPRNRKPVMESFSTTWANSMLHRNEGVSPFSRKMRGGGQ